MSKFSFPRIFRRKKWRPPFEPAFYCVNHIFGYSGDLNSNPTVFFANGGLFFGWINQRGSAHELGREDLKWSSPDYTFWYQDVPVPLVGGQMIELGWFDQNGALKRQWGALNGGPLVTPPMDPKGRERVIGILAQSIAKFPYRRASLGPVGLYVDRSRYAAKASSVVAEEPLRYLSRSSRTFRWSSSSSADSFWRSSAGSFWSSSTSSSSDLDDDFF